MALDLMGLVARLGLDKSEYEQGMKDAEGGFKNFGSNLKKGVANVAKIAAGAATAAAGAFTAVTAAVTKGVSEVAAYGDNIDKASQKLGISAKAYQEWDAVMQHSGTSIDSMGIGMKTLSTKAQEGSKAFKKLGISQKEAAKMSREELFSRTITALQGVQDANKKAQLAQELFGKSAMELGPLLNTTAEDTQAMKDQVNALGGVLSDEAVKASAAYQDTLQDMTTAMDGVKRGVFASFLPSVTMVMQGITDMFTGSGGAGKIRKGVNEFITNMGKTLPGLLKKGLKVGSAVASAVVNAIPDMVRRVSSAIPKAVSDMWNTAKNVLMTQGVQKIAQFLNTIISGGADKGFGPAQQRIQFRLSKLFDNIFKAARGIVDKASELWTTVLQPIFQGLIDILVNHVLPAVNRVMDRLSPVLSWIGEAVSGLFDTISDVWTNIMMPVINAILDNSDAVLAAVGTVVSVIAGMAIANKISYLMGVIQGLFNVVKAHPFAIVIGVIAAAVGWLVHLYQTNEEARDKINAAFEAIKGFWENTLKPAFQDIYSYVVETLIPALIEWWETKFKPAVEQVFTAIVGFWNDTLKPAFQDIYTYVTETLIPSLIEWWDTKLKPTIETVFAAIAGFWTDTLKPAFKEIYEYVVTDLIPTLIVWWEYHLQPAIEAVFTAIVGFWNDTLKPAFQDIYTYVTETLIPALQEKWEAIQPVIETVFTAIKTFWEETARPALEDFGTFVTETLVPALQGIGDKVQYVWDTYLAPLASWLGETFVKAWEAVSTFTFETLIPAMQDIGDKIQHVWETYLKPVAEWIGDTFVTAWEGLKTQMNNLVNFITNVFSGNWSEAWDNLISLVKTPFETLGEILKTPINAVIDLINSMLGKVESAINKVVNGINRHLRIDVDFGNMPDWLGGWSLGGIHWGANLSNVEWGRIERLANGGIVGNGGRAIVGEYAPEFLQVIGGKAVVTPMNTGRFPGGGQEVVVPRNQSRDITIILELDRQQFGKAVYKANNDETQRVGVRMATGGAY